MNICVYGASSALLKNIYYEKTEELGRAMGKRGHGLVFGGGATGMMGAAARGVAAENVTYLEVLPDFLTSLEFCMRNARNLFSQRI